MTRHIQFTYEKLEGGITMIRCPMGENSFLLEGEDRALLIDTGMGIGNLKACVRSTPMDIPTTPAAIWSSTSAICIRRMRAGTGRCVQGSFARRMSEEY